MAAYDVYVQEDDGPWQRWLRQTPETMAWFTGQHGRTYSFYTRAIDNVGNVEDAPIEVDTSTMVAGGFSLALGPKAELVEGDRLYREVAVEGMTSEWI